MLTKGEVLGDEIDSQAEKVRSGKALLDVLSYQLVEFSVMSRLVK